jgi:hypothetical protein
MLRRFFLLLFLSFTCVVHSQSVDGVIASGEYDFSASYDDGGFTVSWTVEGDTAAFAVSAAAQGWVSVGLEPEDAMQGADMIIGWVTEAGDATVLDCYATGPFGPHPPDITLGGSSDLLDAAGTETDGRTVLEFTRKLSTGDRYDKNIPGAGSLRILWAYGEEDLLDAPHSARGSGTLEIAAGRAASGDPGWLVAAHALLLSASFLCLLAGMLISRYFKKKRWWLKTHRALGVSGALLGTAGLIAMVTMLSILSASHMRIFHSYLGLMTLLGMLAAPLVGLRILKARKGKQTLRIFHRWLGRSVLLLMAATIVLGLQRIGIL